MENTSLERAANGIELIIQDLISEIEEQELNLNKMTAERDDLLDKNESLQNEIYELKEPLSKYNE